MRIREIQEKDNNSLFLLIRKSLEDAELNIPGTAYFDESIKAMSEYYKDFPILCINVTIWYSFFLWLEDYTSDK